MREKEICALLLLQFSNSVYSGLAQQERHRGQMPSLTFKIKSILFNPWFILTLSHYIFIAKICRYRVSGCWTIVPSETAEQSCQRLLKSCVSCFFLSFLLTLVKSLQVFCVNTLIIINYFNLGWRLSKLQDYWLIIKVRFFIMYFLPTFVTFQKLSKTQLKLVVLESPCWVEHHHIFCQKRKNCNCKKLRLIYSNLYLFI